MKLFMKRNRRVLVFSVVVMLFLAGVGIVQLVMNQYQPFKDTAVVKVEDNNGTVKKENQPVIESIRCKKI